MTRQNTGWLELLGPLARLDAVGGPVVVEVAGADLDAWFAQTRTLARLQHPAIPPLYDVGRLSDGRVARIRATVTGVGWAQAAHERGDRARAAALIGAAEALAHAHAQGVGHGRFGAEALRLGEGGEVWVVEWAETPLPSQEDDVRALVALVDTELGAAALGEARDALTTAAAVAARLQGWLDGADRRQRALGWVRRAETLFAEGAAAERDLVEAEFAARSANGAVSTEAPEADRHPVWALEDAVEALRRASEDRTQAARRALHAALEQDPALPEAHVAMALSWSEAAASAEKASLRAAQARAELALREHVSRLPPTHPLRARDDRFLRGTGAITLITEPAGARVTLERFEEVEHRLVARAVGTLGHTPLYEVDVAPGSYRLRLEAPGFAPAYYPVHLGRNAHWHGVPPGAVEPRAIPLLPADAVGPDDCYVPAGWFAAGIADQTGAIPPRPLWCDGFVIRRFPVTARELLTWLDALIDAGHEERALALAPRRPGTGQLHYARGADGRFGAALPPAEADLPALSVSFATAAAYANALRATDGLPWRLPMELEWEKAGRGVDGRRYPWGRRRTLRWANLAVPDRPEVPLPVDSFPFDVSPYGVRGLSGNVRDWVPDPWELLGPELPDNRIAVVDPTPDHHPAELGVIRGGYYEGLNANLACRDYETTAHAHDGLGFRLARSIA